jgi:branched-chain amino acid transport system substrate-binding protein
MPVSVRAWAADVNANGGINGRKVRVIFGDDGADPGQALAGARRMVEQDHVLAFVGAASPLSMQSVTPYLEEKKVPVVGTTGGNLADDSPIVFSTALSADLGVGRGTLIGLTQQSNAKSIAFIYCREAASCANQAKRNQEYAGIAGVKIVYTAQVSIAEPDYTTQMVQARNAGAEAVVAIMDYASIVRMLRSAHRQNWYPPFASTTSVYEESFLAAAGADAEGMLAISQGHMPYSISPLLKPYLEAVRRYVPKGAIGSNGSNAWAAAKLLEGVLRRIDGEPTTAKILDGLYGLQGETVGGIVPPLTFPRGPHSRVNLCGVPIKVVDGKFVASKGERFYCANDSGIAPL